MSDEIKQYLKTASQEELVQILEFHELHVALVKQEARDRNLQVVYSALGATLEKWP